MSEDRDKKRKTLSELAAEARSGGLVCPKCRCQHFSRVLDTEPVDNGILRYRECRNCGHRFPTKEKVGK